MTSPQLTVFVPAYNEQANLAACLQAVQARLDEDGVSYELLIVNDGSRDGTGPLADQLVAADPRRRVIHHPQNLGIGGTFVTACRAAQGEWLILIPADLALDPLELRRYLAAAAQADVVVGLRSDRRDYTWARRLVSWVNITLIRLLFGMRERQFQYISMYRTAVLRAITIEYWRSAFFLAEVLIKAKRLGYRLVEVEIRYVPRQHGQPTGAKPRLVLRTVRDLFHFWLHSLAAKKV
jgi:glycosyltransferase involved in cell wall biosynthesis